MANECDVYETVDGSGAHLTCSEHGHIASWTNKQKEALGSQWNRKLQTISDNHKKAHNK